MKYMLLTQTNAPDAQPTCSFEDWVRYDKEVQDAGIRVSSESLTDLVTATRVTVREDGERLITDGPYAESREFLGGFYVIDVPDLDAALDWAARCPGARDGYVDVRPVADLGDPQSQG